MSLFNRDYNKHIILDRENLTMKFGLRFVSLENKWGKATISNTDIDTEDSLNDIPLIKAIKKQTLDIPMELMAFDNLGNPKIFNETFIHEITRRFTGTKTVKELRIGDYFYYGWFTEIERTYFQKQIGLIKATFHLASPHCYSSRLVNEMGVKNGVKTSIIPNKSTGVEFIYPDLEIITYSDCEKITLKNSNDNGVFELTNIPKNSHCYFYGDHINQFKDVKYNSIRISKEEEAVVGSAKVGISVVAKENEEEFDFFKEWNLQAPRLVYGSNTMVLSSNGECRVNVIFQNEINLF
jgi:hypothetical protein